MVRAALHRVTEDMRGPASHFIHLCLIATEKWTLSFFLFFLVCFMDFKSGILISGRFVLDCHFGAMKFFLGQFLFVVTF